MPTTTRITPDAPASRHAAPSRWTGHPAAAALLRTAVFLVPLTVSWLVVRAAGRAIAAPDDTAGIVLWWIGTVGAGLTAALVVDRLARRLLPLATLLRLTLVFPDQQPSRYRVWGSHKAEDELRRRIEHADDAGSAAQDVLSLVSALDLHDRATRGHSERVRLFVELIAEQLKLADEDRDRLRWGALLHDVGKLDVDHDLLRKPDEPTPEEWEALRSHPVNGLKRIGPLGDWLGEWSLAIVHHHERHDGGGYPAGLAGDDISLAGRITSVADAFEVMTANRPYTKAKGALAAREELVRHAGTQFDPRIVRAFLDVSLPRLRLALGPTAALAQLPFLGGFFRLPGRIQTGLLATVTGGAAALSLLGAADLPRPGTLIDAAGLLPQQAQPADPVTSTPADSDVGTARGTPERDALPGGAAPGRGDGAAGGTAPPSMGGTTAAAAAPGPSSGSANESDARVPGEDAAAPAPAPDPEPEPEPTPAAGPDAARAGGRVLVAGQGADVAVGLREDATPFVQVTPHSDPSAPNEAGTELLVQGYGGDAGLDASGPYVRIITPPGPRAGHPVA